MGCAPIAKGVKMEGFVGKIDWVNAEAMKYWSFSSSYKGDKKADTRNMVFSGDFLGSIKIDGYYERLIKDEDGNTFMVARNKNVQGEAVEKIDWVPQIHDFMNSLPNGTVLLSECYLPGNEGSQKITSLLGCLKDKCIARQEKSQKLHFYIFDVMAYDNKDYSKTPFEKRIKIMESISDCYKSEFIEWAQYYEGEELWNNLQSALADGREGMVIMRKDAPVYFKRTPARVSLKIKKELRETIDCFLTGRASAPTKEYTGKEPEKWLYWINSVTGERLPEGQHYFEASVQGAPYIAVTKPYYYHWAGSLEIAVVEPADGRCRLTNDSEWVDGFNIVPIGFISGLTDEVKSHYKDYIGQVVEIGAMQLNETGGLRHAKLTGFRYDKTWTECSINQLKDI